MPEPQSTPSPESASVTTPASAADSLANEQKRDLAFRRRFDVFKGVAAVLGAAAVFIMLTRPDAVLNRSVSRENISRERAELLLEVLREGDPIVRALSLEVIESTYAENEDRRWLERPRTALQLRDRYDELQERSTELERLLSEMRKEQTGERPGRGPAYAALEQEAEQAREELEAIKTQLNKLRLPAPQLRRVSPIGCITLEAHDIKLQSATLLGASLGTKTTEWFDFGTTRDVQFSVEARDGVGQADNLRPGVTYFYRYVTQDAEGTCRGDTMSFTTPGAQ